MLVVMKHGASESKVQAVVDEIERLGYEARPMPGKQRTTVGLMGNDGGVDDARIQGLLGVLEIIPVTKPYKQVSREWRDSDTVVELGNGVRFGGEEINIIAGPCAVEGASEILDIAHVLKAAGATVLWGGGGLSSPGPPRTPGRGLGRMGSRCWPGPGRPRGWPS